MSWPNWLIIAVGRTKLWWLRHREFNHERWLKRHGRVTYTWPRSRLLDAHHTTRRNGTEAVTR